MILFASFVMYHQNCWACVWKTNIVLQETFAYKIKTSNYHKRASRNRIKPTGRGLNETRKWERRLQTRARTYTRTDTHTFFLHVGISWWYAAVHTHKLFIFLTLLRRNNIHPQLNLRVWLPGAVMKAFLQSHTIVIWTRTAHSFYIFN